MERPSFDTLELQFDGQVATVSLNRPDKANCMNAGMWAELQTCFEWLDQEPSVRAIILAGQVVAGPDDDTATVLAEQRAAAIVYRDSYTGKYFVRSLRALTE